MNEITIHEALRRSAAKWGAPGAAWLETLPSRVDELVERWELVVDGQTHVAGQCSIVVPVERADGERCVLKVQWPHEEAEHEADALAAYDGDGAAKLFDEDAQHNALLIERCEPGASAWDAGERGDVLRACAEVMQRLWRAVPDDAPFDRLALAGGRAEKIRRAFVDHGRPFDADLAEAGASMFDELGSTAPARVLVHGDFHPDNVLSAHREPWLAVDPKPLVGDPAFDCAQLVLNLYGRDWPMETAIVSLADAVGVHRERVWGWTVARAVEEITWTLGDDLPIDRDVEMATYFASLRL